MSNNKTGVSLCRAEAEAKLAVLELQRSGVQMNQLSTLERSNQPNQLAVSRYHAGKAASVKKPALPSALLALAASRDRLGTRSESVTTSAMRRKAFELQLG